MASPDAGGYDPDLFVDALDEDFMCPICTVVVKDPLSIPPPCECIGKLYCSSCLGELREFVCPSCRKPFELKNCTLNRFVQGKVESAKMKCPAYLDGCNVQFILGKEEKNLKEHKLKCLFEPINCEDCKLLVFRGEIDKHKEETCPARLVECKFCKERLQATVIETHQQGEFGCSNATLCPLNCPAGATPFPKSRLERHMTVCIKVIIPCRICDVKIKREDYQQHLLDNLIDHLHGLITRLEVVEEENKHLKQALLRTSPKEIKRELEIKQPLLQLDQKFKSELMEVSEDGLSANFTGSAVQPEHWIVGTPPIKIGKFAWRTVIDEFKGSWFCLGISAHVKFHTHQTSGTSTFWGWSNVSFAYIGGGQQRVSTDFKLGDTIDILLDLDKFELTILNLRTKNKLSLTDIPALPPADNSKKIMRSFSGFHHSRSSTAFNKHPALLGTLARKKQGWVPHFAAKGRRFKFHVVYIPVDQFGKN